MGNEGIKHDNGKLRMDLIPPAALRAIARVLTFGANKYRENTWQRVHYKRYVAALLRHMVEYMDDPARIDPDSGLPHIEHVLCNAMFLATLHAYGQDVDTLKTEEETKCNKKHLNRLV